MSKIQWTDETWNPVVGRWTGGIHCDESALEIPLHWRKPRQIFVCSMGDLFHKSVPFEFVDEVMAVIALCPQHTFQVPTKWPERMAEYFGAFDIRNLTRKENHWPYQNCWLGVTVCNQKEADEKIPILLQTPAAVRFVSIEPMLGEIKFKDINTVNDGCPLNPLTGELLFGEDVIDGTKLDWVILGGESGPGARYCSTENIRSAVRQGKTAGVPVFVKQIHLWGVNWDKRLFETPEAARLCLGECEPKMKLIKDINQFPEDLRIREYPNVR